MNYAKNPGWKDKTMTAEKDDGCMCPRCNGQIPDQFYCLTCGYVPDWRQTVDEEHKSSKEAA